MTERDSEVPATVTPQPPLISNYGLVVTVYTLFVRFPHCHHGACWSNHRLPAAKQHRPSMPVAFSFSDKNILDRLGLSLSRASNGTHRNWRLCFALVDHLDTDQVRKGSASIEYRRADTQPELMVVW